MPYQRHPSHDLNNLFLQSDFPHQGQNPVFAKVIFIGLDANYSTALTANEQFFDYVLQYHNDGISFWLEYGVHHPFLHPNYPLNRNTGGVPYHRRFSKMGLDESFSDKVSFIELIPFPTTGRTEESVFWDLFEPQHANKIDSLITKNSNRKLIILSRSVMEKMKKATRRHSVFKWLPEEFELGKMKIVSNTTVFGAKHFSGAVTNEYLLSLGTEIRNFCGNID